ncbi:MAG TPA: hypothetical protein VKB93_23225 [Thermoanaerobaculia bacterium]|nr:hypothetical protein [Thermoanaerobaculia bacterium]
MRLAITLLVIVLAVGVVLSVRLLMKRAAQQRAAHDARLRLMAQATMNAMKKKQVAAAAAPAPGGREERECPYCAELILKKARVCKHCGRDVEPYSQSV